MADTTRGLELARGRILLATGIDAVRLGVRGVLVRQGYVVYEASDRGSAMDLSLRHKGKLDALVLGDDLAFDFLDAVAEPPPTLLLTAGWMGPPDDVLDAYPAIKTVVVRPFALRRLLNAVETTIAAK